MAGAGHGPAVIAALAALGLEHMAAAVTGLDHGLARLTPLLSSASGMVYDGQALAKALASP